MSEEEEAAVGRLVEVIITIVTERVVVGGSRGDCEEVAVDFLRYRE